jgi:hypothetical protein
MVYRQSLKTQEGRSCWRLNFKIYPPATATSHEQNGPGSPGRKLVRECKVLYTVSSFLCCVYFFINLKSDACRKQESKIFLGDAIFPVVFSLKKTV